MLRVAQIGDVAQVAPALARTLSGNEVGQFDLARRGADLPGVFKLAATPVRLADAARVARVVRKWRPDVAHIHWLPNGVIGPMLGCPWLIHIHGDDLRSTSGVRRVAYPLIMRVAGAVAVSTPDLLALAPQAVWLPVPIPELTSEMPERYDVFVNARAHSEKGAKTAFAALRLINEADPDLRLAALDGPEFEEGPWERVPMQPKAEFHRVLGSSKVIVGQFRAGALGIADLEALALDRPLVTWVRDIYPDPPPVVNARTSHEIADAVLAGPTVIGGAEWVRRTHSDRVVLDRLLNLYDRLQARGAKGS